MGLSFNENGIYVGWSNLFDYSSLNTIQASEYLPAPKSIKYNIVNSGQNYNTYLSDIKLLKYIIRDRRLKLRKLGDSADISTITRLRNELDTAESLLLTSGLDINEYIIKIQEFDNKIKDINELLKTINSTFRKATLEEKLILQTKKQLINIELDNYKVNRINTLVKLLNNINNVAYNNNEKLEVNLYYTVPYGDEVMKLLYNHTNTSLPISLQEAASKNFISSHILNTVQSLENMIAAYSPIEMEDFRDASDLSEKGSLSSRMTLLNPTTKMLMLYSNMTGKNVIGIAANGIKASFMWNYYINDVIRNNPTLQEIEYATFDFTLNRVVGRADGNIQEVTLNTLPDINFTGVDPNTREKFGNRLKGFISTDLMSSLVLSAATDNAKELILAKVNAGNKLAKMYLFLIALGVDVRDIVKFMTSNVASFIDLITEENIFNQYSILIQDAILMAKGNFDKMLLKYSSDIINYVKKIYHNHGLDNVDNKNDIIADANEFKNILEGANEFSRFGLLLSLNQGLPINEFDLLNLFNNIQEIVNKRLKEVTIENKEIKTKLENVDAKRWVKDANYREELKELYNLIKKCINIFDVFDKIEQFNAIREILDTINEIDNNISIKSKSFIKIFNKMKQDKTFSTELYNKRILFNINKALITKFVTSLDIKLPIAKNSRYLTSDRSISTFAEDGELSLKSESDIASFKLIFEDIIIPELKKGNIPKYIRGQYIIENDPSIAANSFIQSLIRTSDRKMKFYRSDLNMLTIEDSTESQNKFVSYTQGLLELSTKYINEVSILDWFMLYNLIVHQNQYGDSRFTTLFDKAINSNQDSLLKNYFDFLGKIDYFGEVLLDTDLIIDPIEQQRYKELDKNGLLLRLNYRDCLIDAAATVNSTYNLQDPYVKINTDNGTILMMKNGYSYTSVLNVLLLRKDESIDNFLDRIYNDNNYFTLGSSYNNFIRELIQEIANLGKYALDYINNFIQQGILRINKICQ